MMQTMSLRLAAVAALAVIGTTTAQAEAFNGAYAGLSVGLDNYEVKGSDVFAIGDAYDGLSGNGASVGAYLGYDLPIGSGAFVGAEAFVDTSGAKLRYDDTADAFSLKARESYGISTRIGAKVNDSTGLYARLGWQQTRFKGELNGFADSTTEDGWRYGAGIETSLGSNVALRLEYSIVDYGSAGTAGVLDVKNGQLKTGVSLRF